MAETRREPALTTPAPDQVAPETCGNGSGRVHDDAVTACVWSVRDRAHRLALRSSTGVDPADVHDLVHEVGRLADLVADAAGAGDGR